jgi:Ca2+-binding EF-hand superfamily protein
MNILTTIQSENPQIDYDTFLGELTERLGNIRSKEGRTTLFGLMDKENKGSLTVDDLRGMAREVGHIVSEEDLQEIFKNITKGEVISPEEFERYLARKVEKTLS